MNDKQTIAADATAVRVALWRARHVQIDPPPHVLDDEIGLRLASNRAVLVGPGLTTLTRIDSNYGAAP